jgi:hypothetical protein
VADVAGAVDDVVSLGEQTAEEAEVAADAADEQAATLAEVSDQTRTLSDRATALRDRVDEFEIGEDAGSAADGGGDEDGPDAAADSGVPSARADGFDWQN